MADKHWVVRMEGEEHPRITALPHRPRDTGLHVLAGPMTTWDEAVTWLDDYYSMSPTEKDLLDEEPIPEHDLHHVDLASRMFICNCGEELPSLKAIAEHCGLLDLYNRRLNG